MNDFQSKSKEQQDIAAAHVAPIFTSALITCWQLACLMGGKDVGKLKHRNILKVGTPIAYCGGSALGMKNGIIHHMCLKEEYNYPMPESADLVFKEVYKMGMKGPKSERCLSILEKQRRAIPIFWEPISQERRSPVAGTNSRGVVYAGHWKIIEVENHAQEPIYMPPFGDPLTVDNKPRIAVIHLKFQHYNHRWSNIINHCQDKTPYEIKDVDFANIDGPETFTGGVFESSKATAHDSESDTASIGAHSSISSFSAETVPCAASTINLESRGGLEAKKHARTRAAESPTSKRKKVVSEAACYEEENNITKQVKDFEEYLRHRSTAREEKDDLLQKVDALQKEVEICRQREAAANSRAEEAERKMGAAEQDRDDALNKFRCVLCSDPNGCGVFIPCGHVVCSACFNNMQVQCPKCSAITVGRVPLRFDD